MAQQLLIDPPGNLDERNVWITAVWRDTATNHVECGFVRTDERIAPRLGAGVESGYRTCGVTTEAIVLRGHGMAADRSEVLLGQGVCQASHDAAEPAIADIRESWQVGWSAHRDPFR